MSHAWLDSLSEDWVSQPGSPDASFAPEGSAAASPDPKLPKPQTPSRIPRLSPHARKFQNVVVGKNENKLILSANASESGSAGNSKVLGERSINERLAALSRRTPSKLSQELSPNGRDGRDCHACRSASVSTTNSVVHKKFLRKSTGTTQSKGGDTPEWKRRLVYGDLSYGEQKDLFTSAGTGLENIFKPPPSTNEPSREGHIGSSYHEHDSEGRTAVPDSPSPLSRDPSTVEIHANESQQGAPTRQHPTRAPLGMQYRRTDDAADASRASELGSYPPSHHTNPSMLSGDGESRKVSGRSDIRNEDFSPIILERRQASNGTTVFGPVADLPPDELHKRLAVLRDNQDVVGGDVDGGATQKSTVSQNQGDTPDYAKLEGFVNFQRGSRSEEGSFRHHMLSSALNDSSELNPEESLQASTPKQFPSVRGEKWDPPEQFPADSPDLPRAPEPSPEKRLPTVHLGPDSPFKLFHPYDNFTSETLLRRLSQEHGDAAPGDISFSIAVDESRTQVEGGIRTRPPLPPPQEHDDYSSVYANRFGAGELDGYEFNDEFSHITHDATELDGDKENREPDEESMLPSHALIFDLTHNSSPAETPDLVVNRRRKSTPSHASRRGPRVSFPGYFELSPPGGRRDVSGPEIKRPRTSPSKDPTPKRRRTLHKSDISYGADDFPPSVAGDSAPFSRPPVRSGLGRFRQDAHSDDEYDEDGVVPELRQSVRPRTPTPSQRSSVQREQHPFRQSQRSPLRTSRHGQPMAHPVGAAVQTSRKPSIKTEDFINEANKIMAMIRNKAGLASGLTSVEESDEEKAQISLVLEGSGSYEESTQEPFSRPPSREGRPPLTRKSTKQEDPVLAEQLKKYEEASDMGDFIPPSSVRSARLGAEVMAAARAQAVEDWADHQSRMSGSQAEVISDPPNIRISRNPDWRDEGEDPSVGQGFNDHRVPSHGSAGFGFHNTQGTDRSIPTRSSRASSGSSRSSRNSDARKTIMPESVCHLIPDQVGNMILDRQRNMWVKRKGSGESKESFSQSVLSEDDPFAGIPDLSVDVTKEMQNLLLAGKQEAATAALQARLASAGGLPQISPTKAQRVGSLTRAALDAATAAATDAAVHPNYHPGEFLFDVDHEFDADQGRDKENRRLTISFSSPLASVIQDAASIEKMLAEEGLAAGNEVRDPTHARGGRRVVSIGNNSRGPQRYLSVRGKSAMARPVSRIDERDEESSAPGSAKPAEATSGMELSLLGDYSMVNREDSTSSGQQQDSLRFLVATPGREPPCPIPGIDAAPIISQYVGTLSLSPLSEFTMHRPEETLPFEASYVVGNHRLVTGDPSKQVVSMSIRELVDKLAEVEPFEPYWEDMRELELRDKGLSALHALDEYCGQLESLDVSKNKIRNLGGIPSSILHLRAAHNQLSSLTAWTHLMNLQYIDVSNNGLESLAVFKNLVHLRSLRADNNQITSLDGIKFHKGLQTLRVRGNLIEQVDFDGNTLHQLTDLDLRNNQIRSVAHVEQLAALTSLNLDGNQLTSFSVDYQQGDDNNGTPISPLRYLRLDDNHLTTLNVRALSHLRLLHADRNALVQVAGFSRARRIDSLSLREQHGPLPLDLPHLLARAYEVRKLYLSGNLLESFAPRVDLLNLQLLELANCGLSALPEDVGLALPNLRVLNLNMNALTDLTPLRAVPRLKRLLVAGNRLADPGRVLGPLADMLSADGNGSSTSCLVALDLRDNPLTQGFYAPVQVIVRTGSSGVSANGSEGGEAEGSEMFTLPSQDADRDARYCARLDMDTRMRRRLYETMVGKKCGRVRRLDGLGFGKKLTKGKKGAKSKRIESGMVMEGAGVDGGVDAVWLAMTEKGLMEKKTEKGEMAEEENENNTPPTSPPAVAVAAATANRSGRWPAEDSFA
ncbi:hypothetical protein B0J18DRAFT_398485 [Chaetomium sp. MPI-SDFR-AT-0129]|nr:hypothetical protein B0J18DRAFT_398485 [Chaetomium sp. MPI-SDFR-AT-0129]